MIPSNALSFCAKNSKQKGETRGGQVFSNFIGYMWWCTHRALHNSVILSLIYSSSTCQSAYSGTNAPSLTDKREDVRNRSPRCSQLGRNEMIILDLPFFLYAVLCIARGPKKSGT